MASKSATNVDNDLIFAGSDYLPLGQDSFSQPQQLEDNAYQAAMNIICRGGAPRTRPGSVTRLNGAGSNPQGITIFQPAGGVAHLVFVIDGIVYVSAYPFKNAVALPNIQFSPVSRMVTFSVCTQSMDYKPDGSLYWLNTPKDILIMQDGVTQAAYWDGFTNAHINPLKSGSTVTKPDRDGTVIGLWMIWSNNRLWVARRNQVYASDIGNPLKFTETQYLNNARSFNFSGDVTGVVEMEDRSGIIVFTEREGSFLQTSVQDRSKWTTTDKFQQVIIPSIGCVAGRSIVNQYGLIWWFSEKGLTNLNSAFRGQISSRFDYQDAEMMNSKANLGPDPTGIACFTFENYLGVSVPSGDRLNRHTWVLDQAPFEGNVNAWTSYWTGWRPVQWATGTIYGQDRIFFLSKDYDDNVRVWEAFQDDHTDNGSPILCYVHTKEHNFKTLDRKRFAYAKLFGTEISGNVSLSVYAQGTRGAFQKVMEKEIVSTTGQANLAGLIDLENTLLISNRPQTRVMLTQNSPDESTCNACGVESKDNDLRDHAFALLILWSGDFGFRAYQMVAAPDLESYSGDCETDETGTKTLNLWGCGSDTKTVLTSSPFVEYTGTATDTETDTINAISSTKTETDTSVLGQEDADRRASAKARFNALWSLGMT